MRKKLLAVIILLVCFAAVAWAAAADSCVDQKSVLTGQVVAQGLTTSGSIVREGDVLVFVDTITGPVPAVRATTDGKVKEVLAKPGDMVRTGEVLVRLEPSRK